MAERTGRNIIFRSSQQNLSSLTREEITQKHQRGIRISYVDLNPYLTQQFGFIDPDFPHVASSLSHDEMQGEGVDWLPAEDLQQQTNYSDMITSVEAAVVNRRSMSLSLMLINWFAKDIFGDIFLQQLRPSHLYSFDVMIDGVFIRMAIDSYVPINSLTKKEMFAYHYNGSVFPCIYEKLLAKIYGSYQSISNEFIDIVELQTLFCKQEISLTTGLSIQELESLIQTKISQKSVVSFRTRNSIRLQTLGLSSNHIYIILRLIHRQQGVLVQFLELEGEGWIGKFSKLRSCWRLEQSFAEENKIIISEQYKQNYMSLEDMRGIGRELIVLNNTIDYHKNYQICQSNRGGLSMYRLELKYGNRLMIRANFKQRKCYSTLFVLGQEEKGCRLVKSNFHQNKDSNYIEVELEAGAYLVIVYCTHPQEERLTFNLTLFSSQQFIEILPQPNSNDILYALEVAFIDYFTRQPANVSKNIICKQLYSTTGLAFIFIKDIRTPIEVRVDQLALSQSQIYPLDLRKGDQTNLFHRGPVLLIYRCMWSKKQNIAYNYSQNTSQRQQERIMFPPANSIEIVPRTT